MKRFVLFNIGVLMLLVGCRKDISGTYLANDKLVVCWLQLVRTSDDRLTGQLAISTLNQQGAISHQSVSLTGAVNGENITLNGGRFFGLDQIILSGTYDGNSIKIIGVQSSPMMLQRATSSELQARLGEQKTRSQEVISAQLAIAQQQRVAENQQNFVDEVEHLTIRMQDFDAQADLHLGRFPNAEKGYQAITAKINEYVMRERKLVGSTSHAGARAQLNVAATQISLGTDQMHNQGQALQLDLQTNIAPMMNEVTTIEQRCRQTVPGEKLTITPQETQQSVCSRLKDIAPVFRQKYAAVAEGLIHLESVYKREKNIQEMLLDEAQKLE